MIKSFLGELTTQETATLLEISWMVFQKFSAVFRNALRKASILMICLIIQHIQKYAPGILDNKKID